MRTSVDILDIPCQLSSGAIIAFDNLGAPCICNTSTLDLYDKEIRVCPPFTVELDETAAFWDIRRRRYKLSGRQLDAVLGFAETRQTPLALLGRLRKSAKWTREEFESFVWMLVSKRILEPAQLPQSNAGLQAVAGRSKSATKSRGVVLIAMGPEYHRLAATLAESIKLGSPGLPIALIHAPGGAASVREAERGRTIDTLIEVDPTKYIVNGSFSVYLLKTQLDLITPFDETVFIDADSIIFPGVDLFTYMDRFRDCDIAPAAQGAISPSMGNVWMHFISMGQLRDLFGLRNKALRVSSYFLFFRRTRRTRRFFAESERLYRIASDTDSSFPRYGSQIPDEPVFAAATSLVDVRVFAPYHMPLVERSVLDGAFVDHSLAERHLGMTMVSYPEPEAYIASYNRSAKEVAARCGTLPAYPFKKNGTA